ncbi:acylphosphatase [Candidatus Margulisiibacteriota bacterium]
MTRSRVRVNITGYVQGVGYRFFVIDAAKALDLCGYARNTADGGVEVVAEGEKNSLEQLVNSLKTGPASATISDVAVSYENYLGEFKDFRIG